MAEDPHQQGQSSRRLRHLIRTTQMSETKHNFQNRKVHTTPANSLQHQTMFMTMAETDDIPYPITDEEALHFLTCILKIPQPLELLERDRLEFLNTFLFHMNAEMPFTNIQLVGRYLDKDYSPSFEEGKNAMFARQGGNCLIINMFTKAILDLLGYKTFHIGANNPGDITFDTHVSTIVCDLTFPGSTHLVDPGMARPFYEAIPLDFEKESQVYQFNYLKCKLFKRDHGILHLCSFIPQPQTAPSPLVIESEGEHWKILISYRPTIKRSRAYFQQKMKERFGFPSSMPEIYQVIAVFTRRDGRNFVLGHQGDFFALKYMHKDPLQSDMCVLAKEEYLSFIAKELPQFPPSLVEKAIETVYHFKKLYCV